MIPLYEDTLLDDDDDFKGFTIGIITVHLILTLTLPIFLS